MNTWIFGISLIGLAKGKMEGAKVDLRSAKLANDGIYFVLNTRVTLFCNHWYCVCSTDNIFTT